MVSIVVTCSVGSCLIPLLDDEVAVDVSDAESDAAAAVAGDDDVVIHWWTCRSTASWTCSAYESLCEFLVVWLVTCTAISDGSGSSSGMNTITTFFFFFITRFHNDNRPTTLVLSSRPTNIGTTRGFGCRWRVMMKMGSGSSSRSISTNIFGSNRSTGKERC